MVIGTDCTDQFNCHTYTVTTRTVLLRTKTQSLQSYGINSLLLLQVATQSFKLLLPLKSGGDRGRVRMIVGFTTTDTFSANHHLCCEFESRPGRDVQHYVIKFVSDLRQVGGFFRGPPVSSISKSDHHDITEIPLKVAFNTIKQTNKQT